MKFTPDSRAVDLFSENSTTAYDNNRIKPRTISRTFNLIIEDHASDNRYPYNAPVDGQRVTYACDQKSCSLRSYGASNLENSVSQWQPSLVGPNMDVDRSQECQTVVSPQNLAKNQSRRNLRSSGIMMMIRDGFGAEGLQ